MGTLLRDRHGRQIGANDPGSLAAAAGISQGYRSQLEADEREPTLAIAARLARRVGMSLDELASGSCV